MVVESNDFLITTYNVREHSWVLIDQGCDFLRDLTRVWAWRQKPVMIQVEANLAQSGVFEAAFGQIGRICSQKTSNHQFQFPEKFETSPTWRIIRQFFCRLK